MEGFRSANESLPYEGFCDSWQEHGTDLAPMSQSATRRELPSFVACQELCRGGYVGCVKECCSGRSAAYIAARLCSTQSSGRQLYRRRCSERFGAAFWRLDRIGDLRDNRQR